ncbi:glycoside hydrolase family 3 protein [Serpula lacrymans var. lacrymans S7.3]|uniref:beta-glucosidase n=2 Tax=Serpula lacrymans var. lacrymans TaxID=341189 RepID=F8Q6T4_SERL3|nr:glycoside hydrolase family 3 protein [Serpula lacrymans var. lacrymans S7.9]EGN96322.1 glycoside hydrolase family 3 protein [Serpula lacrymans var. lacrymans S7.3]EGO21859.1 glycoside hydrolase family 3 protein [Serpula lacrymans var. lacrymans S7.9]
MPPSDFANADIDQIVESLTTDEAILLTAGVGFWHTHAVPRLGIPAIKVSDGPNGIRGNHFFMSTPAKCLPSSTALGATFDTELIEYVGRELLAKEARLKAAPLTLAPTCNIQRNPLGGRSFESFSEDPLLSGLISAAYVKGVQSGGIGTTIKHFVCNDKENDRMAYDSILSERALREIYLMPFMLAQKYAKPWSFMTAYNRVNGTHASENTHVLQDILRKEWGFDGLIMSDWFGVYSIDHALNSGLDLEMPGTNKWRTLDLVNRSIQSRKVTVRTVKERARKVVELAKRAATEAGDILDGDGLERTYNSAEDRALMRNVAASSIVLLKNDESLLPLRPSSFKEKKKIAIIGGNAKAIVLSGGGSAALKPSYFVTPYDGIVEAIKAGAVGDVEIAYSEGAATYMTMPSLDYDMLTASGEPGWIGTWYSHEHDESMSIVEKPLEKRLIDETRIFISTSIPEGITRRWTMKLEGKLKPRTEDCVFEFGLSVAGRAKLYVDGKLVIDNWTRQRRGDSFFGSGSVEEKGTFPLPAGHSPHILVEFCNVRAPADGDEDEAVMDSNPGVRLGGAEVKDADESMKEALTLAEGADVVVAVVGLNADWETEGYDRTTLGLPGRTDELIREVIKRNKNTVVITQSGSSITMPWADDVPAILHSWYLGNATGEAIADVLFGKVNPSGRLSLTFPKRYEDIASYGHFHSENGVVRYGEDLYVGYKHFQHRKIAPQFAFGHGLSYTTFAYSDLQLPQPVLTGTSFSLTASLTLTNTGSVSGSEVVQLYVSMPHTLEVTHPPLNLRAFKKVKDVKPGESIKVHLELDKYAVSFWEERITRWVVEKGPYGVKVGSSSENFKLEGDFTISKGFEWNGL